MMKTREEIEAELEKVDALIMGSEPMPMYQITTLEAYQDALAWVLGQREESPSQKGA